MHGEMIDGKKVTLVVFELNKNTSMNLIARTYSQRLIFGVERFFYDEHFTSIDIKFNGLVVNLKGINKWITPSDILFSENEGQRQVWNIDINESYSIKFLYEKPITDSDDATVDNIGENVYIRIDSQSGSRNFEELLEQKNVIQDFLNFVITENSVFPQSVYGIIRTGDSEKLVKTRNQILLDSMTNKSKNTKTSVI
jgi:hypothetical protein